MEQMSQEIHRFEDFELDQSVHELRRALSGLPAVSPQSVELEIEMESRCAKIGRMKE